MGIETEFRKGCSIVIPTWNCECTIEKCVESIPAAFPKDVPLELIIVDKSSDDNTVGAAVLTIVLGGRDIEIKVVKEDRPLGAARMTGIKHAQYPTIFWLDSDITLPENYIENLFKMLKNYEGKPVGQLQGTMVDTVPLIAKWWAGYDVYQRRKSGKKYIVAKSNAPTACSLLLKSATTMTREREEYMNTLHSTEDSLLAKTIQEKGYCQLMFPIKVDHNIKEVDAAEGSHKMVWSLVGLKNRGDSKLQALWHMKWIWRNGFFAFIEHKTFDLIAYTVYIQLNLIRACIKDKRIIKQRRIVTLEDW
jgi:glycosyltransferase involved in cell wall biosynthesis